MSGTGTRRSSLEDSPSFELTRAEADASVRPCSGSSLGARVGHSNWATFLACGQFNSCATKAAHNRPLLIRVPSAHSNPWTFSPLLLACLQRQQQPPPAATVAAGPLQPVELLRGAGDARNSIARLRVNKTGAKERERGRERERPVLVASHLGRMRSSGLPKWPSPSWPPGDQKPDRHASGLEPVATLHSLARRRGHSEEPPARVPAKRKWLEPVADVPVYLSAGLLAGRPAKGVRA